MISKTQSTDASVLDELVDKICAMLQSGKQVDIDQLASQHPEMAQQLRKLYPTLLAINTLDATVSPIGSPNAIDKNHETQTLGDFQILRQIGRGGMGIVYEAQQLTINRKVALKILPLAALVDERALQRFKNEVAAIATLQHPHIVSVYSIGEERGIHYFAMQLIRGQSLAAVIRELRARTEQEGSVTGASLDQVVSDLEDEQKTDPPLKVDEPDETAAIETRARGRSTTDAAKITDQTYFRNVVGLIQQAAEALQHAHDHGIVHRDVKPGNLLLDKHGSLFVTDFGLARIETAAGVTMTGDVLGTLRYMSPEQVLANRVVVDHRTDVYSLGATLYELLTLQPIWSGDNKAELIRQISSEEPLRPQKLNPAIPADLETIVLKAISKNPSDRYDSAQSFGEDLQRYRDHKPVLARRPTTVQRLNKWTRRHPTLVGASLLIMLIVTFGSVLCMALILSANNRTRQALLQSRQAEQLAQDSLARAQSAEEDAKLQRDDAVLQKERAELEAAIAEEFNEFVNLDLLGRADPHEESNRDLKVSEVLDRALISLGKRFTDQPLVEAEIRNTIGRAFDHLGRHEESKQQFNFAQKIYDRELRSDTREALGVEWYLAWILHNQGRYQDSLDQFEDLLNRCREILGNDDILTLRTMSSAADIRRHLGQYTQSERLFRDVLENQKRVLGPDHNDTLVSMNGLATAVYLQGRYAQAEKLYRELLELQTQVYRPDHPGRLTVINNLADAIAEQGRAAEAEKLYRELLDIQERVLGPEHPSTLSSMSNLALALADQGHYVEAEKLLRTVLDVRKRLFGNEHPETLTNLSNLATQIRNQGRSKEAEKLFFDVWEIKKRVIGPDHPSTLTDLNNLAVSIADQRRYEEAEKIYWEVLESRKRVLGNEHPRTLITRNNFATTIFAQGRYHDAEKISRESLEISRRILGPEHPDTLISLGTLGAVIHKQKRYEEAEEIYRQVLDARTRVIGSEHPHTLVAKRELGILMLDQERNAEAETILREVYDIQKRLQGTRHKGSLKSLQKLADSVAGQGRYEEAEKLHRQTAEDQAGVLYLSHPDLLATQVSLANDLLQLDCLEESESMAMQVIDQLKKGEGAGDPLMAKAASVLESSLRRQGRTEEADRVKHELISNKEKD